MQFYLVFYSLAIGAVGSSIESTVNTTCGVVVGNPRGNTGVLEFLGIPFAAPPIGNLRWKPPQPVPKQQGTVNATSFGFTCYQTAAGVPPSGPQSEDCLTINVWTEATETTEKRPVMIWFYGGGFQFGSSAQPYYNGTNLSKKEVVVVSFNYRLGVLGFLALPDLDAEGTNSGNFGLQDQITALKWVKANIANFGGDPDNVTIFGESAGAHAIGLLLSSQASTGLFHKAIMESGAYWDTEHGSLPTFDEAREKGAQLQKKLGVSSLAELRALPAEQVNNGALWNSSTDPALTAFAPNIDRYIISAAPATIFDKGQTQKVPVLAGFNAEEEGPFLALSLPHHTAAEYRSAAKSFFASDQGLELYPGNNDTQATQSASDLVGDLIIREQTWEALDSQANSGGKPCYGYYFTYTSPYVPQAIHGAELNFVFGNIEYNSFNATSPSAADVWLSTVIMTYWTNFAKTGNPNGNGSSSLPYWPRYMAENGKLLQFGNEITAIDIPNVNRFRFIRGLRLQGVLPLRWRNEFTAN